MAIYHCSIKIIGRSSSRSAVASSAYRAGEKIKNDYDGIEHDYSKRKGVVHTEILKPEHAPDWVNNRATLWNEVEKIEKQSNSQLAREIEIALPNELNRQQQIELLRDYVKDSFVNKGMVADVAVHDKSDGNPHAHIMLTMRPFNEDGTWGAKSKKEYLLNEKGEKIKLPSGEYKSKKVDTTDWNNTEKANEWRENWAITTNKHLEKYGHPERIDHRSYEKQGIDKTPTKHMGKTATQIEKEGGKSIMGDINREIQRQNKILEDLKKEYEKVLEEYKQEQQRQEDRKRQEKEEEQAIRPEPASQQTQQQPQNEIIEQQPDELDRTHNFDKHYSGIAGREGQALASTNSRNAYNEHVEKTSQEYADKLYSLHENHKALEMRKTELQNLQGEKRQQSQNINSKLEDLKERRNLIENYEKRLKELREEQQSNGGLKGLFRGREKQTLNEKVKMVENSYRQALENLKREYNITFQETDKAREQLQQQKDEYSKIDFNSNLQELRNRQQSIEKEYKQLFVEKELGNRDIKEKADEKLNKKFEAENQGQERQSLDIKRARIESDRRLNTFTENDKKEISQKLVGNQKEAFKDMIKDIEKTRGHQNNKDLTR